MDALLTVVMLFVATLVVAAVFSMPFALVFGPLLGDPGIYMSRILGLTLTCYLLRDSFSAAFADLLGKDQSKEESKSESANKYLD